MKPIGYLTLGAVFLGGVAFFGPGDIVGTLTRGYWSPIKRVEPARGSYFRVTSKYHYMGEPVTLEFALTCGGTITRYKGGDASYDVSISPNMYGLPLPDGKALVLATRNFCDGIRPTSPNGGFPPAFLPATIVYDDAKTLSFGILYGSDEAYDNPNAPLKFDSFALHTLSYDDYKKLRASQPKNVVRSLVNEFGIFTGEDMQTHEQRFPGKKPAIATKCRGYFKVAIPEPLKEQVREGWPQDKPRYWQYSINGDPRPGNILRTRISVFYGTVQPEEARRTYGFSDREPGIPRVRGGGTSGYSGKAWGAPRYPLRYLPGNSWNSTLHKWEPGHFVYRLETKKDEARGFLYCSLDLELQGPTPLSQFNEAIYKRFFQTKEYPSEATAEFVVDDQPVHGTVRHILGSHHPMVVFENDEFAYIRNDISFGHTFGEQADAE